MSSLDPSKIVFICFAMNSNQPSDLQRLQTLQKIFSAKVYSVGKASEAEEAVMTEEGGIKHISLNFKTDRFIRSGSAFHMEMANLKSTNHVIIGIFDWWWFDIIAGFGITPDGDAPKSRSTIYGQTWFTEFGHIDKLFLNSKFDMFIFPNDTKQAVYRLFRTVVKNNIHMKRFPKENNPLFLSDMYGGSDITWKTSTSYMSHYLYPEKPFIYFFINKVLAAQILAYVGNVMTSRGLKLKPKAKRPLIPETSFWKKA